MIPTYTIDFVKTFGGVAILAGVEPKMQRADGLNGAQEQAKDKEGNLKWTLYMTVQTKAFDKIAYDTLSVTITSPTKPGANLAPGTPIVVESLQLGLMPQEKGKGFSVFHTAESVRPLQPARASSVASGQ